MIEGTVLDLLVPATGIEIDSLRCLHRRFARSRCRFCADACPSGAMKLEAGPLLDARRCTSCRRCEAACPVGAVRGDESATERLAVALSEHQQPVLGCRREGVTAQVRTGCLGFLEGEWLLTLALLFPAGITLNLSQCGRCDKTGTAERLEAALKGIRRLPGMAGRVMLHLATEDVSLAGEEVDLSRRAFFSFLGRSSQETAVQAVARQLQPEPTLRQKQLPVRRRHLLQALNRLSIADRDALGREIFPAVSFTPSCTGCTGCVGICPTGAIGISDDEPLRPVFNPRLCTGCGLCREFCRKGGVTVARPAYTALLAIAGG
ncbi:MAG: hypothetical protein A2005_09345 [Desulfuromonadales bacterium GWC2_61_20]|nr:MAG: hypothetical protein A2005_09345 [Desulfuromonadales bacterium GWC2_61_20]HAD04149.1 hypothetical protein [Desulfuromonas sp.]